jgi:hypothetical protein
VEKYGSTLVVVILSLAFLSPQEIFSSQIQDITDEDDDYVDDDYQETPESVKGRKKQKKRQQNFKNQHEIQIEEDDYDEEASKPAKQKKRKQTFEKKKLKEKHRSKREFEEFLEEEEDNGHKILWNLKNLDLKKKIKRKFGKKRRKRKRDYERDYENNNKQFGNELGSWPNNNQLDYRMFQRNNGSNMQHKPDWRNEIAGDKAEGKVYASSQKNSEIILDPVVDSSKFKASSLKVNVQPAIELANNNRAHKGLRVVEWPQPIREIDTSSQMVLGKNTDDELEKISEKISLQEPNAGAKENFIPDKKSETSGVSKRRRHKVAPRESIKLRQELEMYRQMYAESFDEARTTLKNDTRQDVKA